MPFMTTTALRGHNRRMQTKWILYVVKLVAHYPDYRGFPEVSMLSLLVFAALIQIHLHLF